mgnify:FL=1
MSYKTKPFLIYSCWRFNIIIYVLLLRRKHISKERKYPVLSHCLKWVHALHVKSRTLIITLFIRCNWNVKHVMNQSASFVLLNIMGASMLFTIQWFVQNNVNLSKGNLSIVPNCWFCLMSLVLCDMSEYVADESKYLITIFQLSLTSFLFCVHVIDTLVSF